MGAKCTFITFLLVLTNGLLAWPENSIQETSDVPGVSSRASRLLYSPRSTNRLSDMHTVLRRLRENNQALPTAASIDQPNNEVETGMTQSDAEAETNLKEICHARILQKCGAAVIEAFSGPNLPWAEKCRIRENFLHCVIKLKRRTCRSRPLEDIFFTEESIKVLRKQMLSLLWTARGCVLGMDTR